jgi:regulator of sigma E protease
MEHFLSLAHQYALPFIAVISVVVFVHEYGHYLVARMCGIKVVSFSIGFGPKLFGWTDKQGTVWQVSLLPLGGYVKMYGDADAASSPGEAVKTMTEEEKKISFYHQPVDKRIAVVSAGPVSNYAFAIIVLAALFMFQGQPFSPPTVGSLTENSVAGRAGLVQGDRVISIDGSEISRFEEIKRIVSMNSGTAMQVVVERNGERSNFSITPEVTTEKDRFGGQHTFGRIGIVSEQLEYKKWPPHKALGYAVLDAWNMSVDTLKALGQIIAGTRGSGEIGGPLRIAEMSGKVAQDGISALIYFMAVISINLGLINLFPIPLLDGGHILFYSLEKLLGRPLKEQTQEIGMRIGLTFVITLMLFATWNDLVHLEVFSKIKNLFS